MATSASTSGLASVLTSDNQQICVGVRFSRTKNYMVTVNVKDTIQDLKEMLAREAGLSPKSINLVLTGQLLNDTLVIQDCGLGSHTTLHAFCWSDDGLASGDLCFDSKQCKVAESKPEASSSTATFPRVAELLLPHARAANRPSEVLHPGESDVDGDFLQRRAAPLANTCTSGSSAPSKQAGFNRLFVYCKLCECVQPGKLRLCCKQCGNGLFLVDRGPSNWSDILLGTSIRGVCKTLNCGCDTPKFSLRCSVNHEGKVDSTAVGLKHVQANTRRVECIICSDVMTVVLIFPCSPGHVICLDCFCQYGSSCLSDRQFVEHHQHGYTLPCPAGCPDSHIEENHHFLLLGPEKYERYKNFGAEEYVLQNGGILCPGPGCGAGLFPATDDRLIRCRECRFECCRDCRREYHTGDCEEYLQSLHLCFADLEINDERAQRASWERESTSLIEETTKSCPGCQSKIERNGGCMHMVCTRCKTEWCWVCVKPWNRECQADHWFGL